MDAIACGLPDGETPPGPCIRYLADQLNLYWQPPKQQEAKPDKPPPEKASAGTETGGLPVMLETLLFDVPFWRVEARDFFSDENEEANTRTASTPSPHTGWRGRPTQPPRFQPLATWAELAPRLRQVLSDYREGRAIDVELTVWHIIRGDVLEYFPHERRRRWGPSLLLIEDDSRRLIPYRADKRLVREAVRCLLPTHALRRSVINDGLDRPFLVGGEPDDWPPPPGTLVLALGDLGCLAVQGSGLRQRWQEIGLELREAGCHPLALFPAPAARCPPDLAGVWRIIPWERPRLADDGRTPADRAGRLLRLVAPASRIEPRLLRAARLLLPADQADAGTEADVWQHPSLISDSAAAATLLPAEAQKLRLAFSSQEHPDIRRRLIRLLKTLRGSLPEEIWYDELLNFDPTTIPYDSAYPGESGLNADLGTDLDDARRYFAKFCEENPASSTDTMLGGDRAWIARLQARSTQHLWKDPQIGARLAELAIEITSEIPIGIHPGDIPARGQPERRVYLIQTGNALSVVHALSEPVRAGSLWADMTTRNGLIEFEQKTDSVSKTESVFDDFWETGIPPPWASDWGLDEYGAWVEFSVEDKVVRHSDGYKEYDGYSKYDRNNSHESIVRVTQRMRWIEPGTFKMGSPETEAERYPDESPQHEVNIKEGYWLFDTACTQALWDAVIGDNPSSFKGADRPVEQVSWNDAQQFIQALNQLLPGLDLGLPSEAQWEYACRAGTDTPFSFDGGNITPEQVNYDGNYPYPGGAKGLYRQETVPVKSLPANPWGLYEMHGNVREWVQDAWHDNYNGAPTDGSVWESAETGAARVLRGGSWSDDAGYCRSAARYYSQPGVQGGNSGFRCARVQVGELGGQGGSGAHEPAKARPAERSRPGLGRFVARSGEFARSQAPACCLLYTSPSPRDRTRSRMPSSA